MSNDAAGIPAAADATKAEDAELDVRNLPHASRHGTIFGLLGRLVKGQALVITVDHDPQPLRYQADAIHPGEFSWEYLEKGPAVFRIAIRRQADAA